MDAPGDPQTPVTLIKLGAALWVLGTVVLNFLARVWFKDHEKLGDAVTKEDLDRVETTLRREMLLQMRLLRAELGKPERGAG